MKRNQRKGDKMRVLWFCVLAALVAAPVWAQYPEGAKNRSNDGNARLVVTDASDTTNVLVKAGGVSGALSVDDADRDRDKTDALTLLSAVSLAAATSSSVSAFVPFTQSYADAIKWLRVTITGGSAGAPWSLVLLGSDDASTYYPIMNSPLPIAGVHYVELDTLKIRGHGPTSVLIPVATRSGYPVITKNLAVIARHDSSAAAAALVFTVEALGRGF